MASNQSDVSICNLALARIGDQSITSLSDNTNQAIEANRFYAASRDMELRAHNWNFAMKRTSLAADGTAPSWDYDKRDNLPSDCLRLVKVDYTDDWRVEGGNLGDSGNVYLVTNLSGPVYILYVARITDPAVFDVLFVNLLAARLAMEMAPRLSQSNTVVERATQGYEYWASQARAMDAQESSRRPRRTSSWVSRRSSGWSDEAWS